jgi:hypothetical protein
MRHNAASPRLLALCAATALLLPGVAQAGRPGTTVTPQAPSPAGSTTTDTTTPDSTTGPTSSTAEYTSSISEVDACNQAQYRMPQNATATAMKVSTAIEGEYATFTCRVNWSLSPSARPTYRPILFSPSA